MELTRRQEIMVMLRERQWTLDELARNFVVSKKVIINDLEHIARSIARTSLRPSTGSGGSGRALSPSTSLRTGLSKRQARLQIHPPTCESCGFRFKDRARFSDPSRCPRCRNEHLRSRFQIA
jgi:predicted Zn-ribbon and HTH transcriptional regulator